MNEPSKHKGSVTCTILAERSCPNCDSSDTGEELKLTYEYKAGTTYKAFSDWSNEERVSRALKITEWCWHCGWMARIK